jgi:hypothetical protein
MARFGLVSLPIREGFTYFHGVTTCIQIASNDCNWFVEPCIRVQKVGWSGLGRRRSNHLSGNNQIRIDDGAIAGSRGTRVERVVPAI